MSGKQETNVFLLQYSLDLVREEERVRTGILIIMCLRQCWYRMIRYLNMKWYSFVDMRDTMGTKLCLFIVLAQHLMKGVIYGGGSGGIIGIPILFLFKSYAATAPSLTAIQMQIFKNIALTPWALKSLIGILSDTVNIGGYHKIPYIFVSIMIAALASLTLAGSWPVDPVIVTILLFLMYMACSVTDLLTEARYSECINEHPRHGPNISSFVWMGISMGAIISTIPVGILLEYVEPHWLYFIPVVPMILILYPVYQNWLGDELHINKRPAANGPFGKDDNLVDPTTNCCGNNSYGWFTYVDTDDDDGLLSEPRENSIYMATGDAIHPHSSSSSSEDEDDVDSLPKTPCIGIKMTRIRREWRPILLSVCIALLSIGTSIMGILQVHTTYLCIVSLVGSVLMIIGFNVLIGGVTARIQTYVMIQNMFSMSISSAEFFFMTDTAEQYPDGPHFSKSFYVIAIGLTASICSIIGSLSYVMFMQHWRYRTVFYFSNSVSILLGLLNVVFYKRWNRLIGIPDEIFVVGSEVLQVIVGTWNSAPISVAMASLCPKNIEAIMYALLAGSSNLGGSLSQYVGASLLAILEINPRGAPNESSQFDNLWLASLVTTLLPVVTLITIPLLIPDKLQTESLIEKTEEDSYYVTDYEHAIVDRFIDDEDDSTTINDEDVEIVLSSDVKC